METVSCTIFICGVFQAYFGQFSPLAVCAARENSCGRIWVQRDLIPDTDPGDWDGAFGVCDLRLIDQDADGVQELMMAWSVDGGEYTLAAGCGGPEAPGLDQSKDNWCNILLPENAPDACRMNNKK